MVGRRGKPAVPVSKVHVGADADTSLVEPIAVTAADVADSKAGPAAGPDDPGEVFADCAHRGRQLGDAVRAEGGTPRIAAAALWGRDEAEPLARLDAWNRPIDRVRQRIETIFGTWTRSDGRRRMRWRGMGKATRQIHVPAIADDLTRALTLTAAV
ncbi:transposase [Rhodoplanes azumiensis]|uniref:Transposase n=1 Tax=Rhodoplanes azumiensis TaxID=1897628 RepID=A0ABW5AJM2_9BRAD